MRKCDDIMEHEIVELEIQGTKYLKHLLDKDSTKL